MKPLQNRSIYKCTRERVNSGGSCGRWRPHLMRSCFGRSCFPNKPGTSNKESTSRKQSTKSMPEKRFVSLHLLLPQARENNTSTLTPIAQPPTSHSCPITQEQTALYPVVQWSGNFVPFFQGLGRSFVTAWLFLCPEIFVIKGTVTLSEAHRKGLRNLISHLWVSID